MRLIYIAAVPVLGTAFVAWVVGAPRSWMPPRAPRRYCYLLAGAIAIALGILSICAVHLLEHYFLGGAPLSRRPFLTHFVTTLVMEPNNNSFPCFEVMFAAALATLLWAARPRVGLAGWIVALLLAVARLYCGSNYSVDVGIGLLWGLGIAAIALACCGISLTFPLPQQKHLRWRPHFQAAFSVLLLIGSVLYVAGPLARSPRHFPPLFNWLHGAKAAAATPEKSTLSNDKSSNDATQKPREMLLLTDAVRQDGYLPAAEDYLRRVLAKQRTGMPLLGVNVAEVKAGKVPYRCAAIRFEVPGKGNAERQRVTAVAVRLLKTAFHADARINHIDILGMKMRLQHSLYNEGGTPVFTASVNRDDLILHDDRAWLNAPHVNPGLWLRARSLLYFDPQILPSSEIFPVDDFLQQGGVNGQRY